jgi:uncharacterized protein YbjT (DUF2867 family)
MPRVMIIGAHGQLARNTTPALLQHEDVSLTLYLRRAHRLANPNPERVSIVEGDVMDRETLETAMRGHEVIYANLAGDMAAQARNIIAAMHATGIKRLIFISSMGIYNEVPGQHYRSILDPYRDSAALIEASDLDYTILRPGWFTPEKEVNYQLTQKGEPFRGHEVSLNSLSDLIVKLALDPHLEVRCSIGISKT